MNILYPGSFNPVHEGHLNILQKIKKIFPTAHIIIAALDNPCKTYDEAQVERKERIKQSVGDGYRIITGELLIDEVIRGLGIDLVVRGMRNYEDPQEDVAWIEYVQNNTDVDIIYIKSDKEVEDYSSSKIRERLYEDETRKNNWTVIKEPKWVHELIYPEADGSFKYTNFEDRPLIVIVFANDDEEYFKQEENGKTKMVPEENAVNQQMLEELLDRVWAQMDMVETYLLSHPAVDGDKELKKLTKKVFKKYWNLYQKVGEKVYD